MAPLVRGIRFFSSFSPVSSSYDRIVASRYTCTLATSRTPNLPKNPPSPEDSSQTWIFRASPLVTSSFVFYLRSNCHFLSDCVSFPGQCFEEMALRCTLFDGGNLSCFRTSSVRFETLMSICGPHYLCIRGCETVTTASPH